MTWVKNLVENIGKWFVSGEAEKNAKLALDNAAKALPYVALAADVVTAITPTPVDDVIWRTMRSSYPSLFDGSVKTGAELGVQALLIASERFKEANPGIATGVARAATQLAYFEFKEKQEQNG